MSRFALMLMVTILATPARAADLPIPKPLPHATIQTWREVLAHYRYSVFHRQLGFWQRTISPKHLPFLQ